MKKIISVALLCLGLVLGLSYQLSAGPDQIISVKQLPAAAQKFLSQHFAKHQVSVVKLDKELFSRSYELIFADGSKVEFDGKGVWKDIDCKPNAVPASCVPAPIAKHIKQNFSANRIVQIEKSDRGRYSVELDNGVELLFDKKFRFIGLDD